MKRVKVSTGEVFSLAEIARIENLSLNPLGDPDLSGMGYDKFVETPAPSVTDAHVTEDGVELVDGEWKTKWKITPFTQDEMRAVAKMSRQAQVSEIKVTTISGKTFDGDETSQTRMARAIIAMQATGAQTVTWVLADNTATQATVAELTEALALAGGAQAAIWVIE